MVESLDLLVLVASETRLLLPVADLVVLVDLFESVACLFESDTRLFESVAGLFESHTRLFESVAGFVESGTLVDFVESGSFESSEDSVSNFC